MVSICHPKCNAKYELTMAKLQLFLKEFFNELLKKSNSHLLLLKSFWICISKKKICIRRRANLLPSLLSSDLVRLISWEENSRKTNELHFQRRRGIDSSFNEGANIHLSFSLAEFDRIEPNFTSFILFFSYITKEKIL